MRHALYAQNWWQLEQLLQLLDAENHDIYVHIDKKSKDFDKTYFNDTVKNQKCSSFRNMRFIGTDFPKYK